MQSLNAEKSSLIKLYSPFRLYFPIRFVGDVGARHQVCIRGPLVRVQNVAQVRLDLS